MMDHEDWIEDIEALFERQPKPMPRDAALAIYGYITGLSYAHKITLEDSRRFKDRLPIDGSDLSETGVNL